MVRIKRDRYIFFLFPSTSALRVITPMSCTFEVVPWEQSLAASPVVVREGLADQIRNGTVPRGVAIIYIVRRRIGLLLYVAS